VQQGLIKSPETIVEGLENAPAAFVGIFGNNLNIGKLLVKVA
jgi:NADPH-dependent curcumin reductase CurA